MVTVKTASWTFITSTPSCSLGYSCSAKRTERGLWFTKQLSQAANAWCKLVPNLLRLAHQFGALFLILEIPHANDSGDRFASAGVQGHVHLHAMGSGDYLNDSSLGLRRIGIDVVRRPPKEFGPLGLIDRYYPIDWLARNLGMERNHQNIRM